MKKRILFLLCLFPLLRAEPQVRTANEHADPPVVFRDPPVPSRPDWAPFLHGVASGDPLPDGVLLWTRVTPGEAGPGPIEVAWKLAADPGLENVVQSGNALAGPETDYTVKIEVGGLSSGSTYYYGFSALGQNSLTGKTRTAPEGDQAVHLRFGVASCSKFQVGYFNAYQRLAERNDLDAIIHLGDYIYESYNPEEDILAGERPVAPEKEPLNLAEYRARYASYRLDTSLIRVHQQHPFIAVWDDHEFSNNAFNGGAGGHNPNTEGDWSEREAAARQAYFEWMPIRDGRKDGSIYRKINYGNLMELILLDTRLEGRQEQVYDPFDPVIQEADRTILGQEQKAWLLDQLAKSEAKWKIIGQQVPFSPLELGWSAALDQDPGTRYEDIQGGTLDAWNGYPEERRQIIDFLLDRSIDNVVILTGSYHISLAFEVTPKPVDISFQELENGELTPFYSLGAGYDPDTGEGSVAVEFATPSISSYNFDENFGPVIALATQQLINRNIDLPGFPKIGNPNPHLKYPELTSHGYYILDVKPDSVQANWYFSDVLRISEKESFAQAWYTRNGEMHLRQAPGPSPPKASGELPAPAEPPEMGTTGTDFSGPEETLETFGAFPNPFKEHVTVSYSLGRTAELSIDLLDSSGKTVRSIPNLKTGQGTFYRQIDTQDLPAGNYVFRIKADNRLYHHKVILAK